MRDQDLIDLFEMYSILTKRWSQEWNRVNQNMVPVTHALVVEMLGTEGKQKASSIANALSITTGGITGIIDKMEKEGLVKRTRDANDRRVVYVEITDQGIQMVQELREQRIRLMQDFLANLTESEMKDLLQIYKKLM